MTKVAVWCRHKEDNIIAIGKHIPWNIPSDTLFFTNMVQEKNVVMGRLTYEALPNRTIPNCKIFILTSDFSYKPSDKENHFVVDDINFFKDFAEDLYIAGGAGVYTDFLTKGNKLLPDIVMDCVYEGEMQSGLKGEKREISACIPVLQKKYIKVAQSIKDNVQRNMYIKRGEFVDQAVMKNLLTQMQK